MKQMFAALLVGLVGATAARAECIVADPTGTPLNARKTPNGAVVQAKLVNGREVTIISSAVDQGGRPWVYVSDPRTRRPIGWVFRAFLDCEGAPAAAGGGSNTNVTQQQQIIKKNETTIIINPSNSQ